MAQNKYLINFKFSRTYTLYDIENTFSIYVWFEKYQWKTMLRKNSYVMFGFTIKNLREN